LIFCRNYSYRSEGGDVDVEVASLEGEWLKVLLLWSLDLLKVWKMEMVAYTYDDHGSCWFWKRNAPLETLKDVDDFSHGDRQNVKEM
jgi:hypothetical protein